MSKIICGQCGKPMIVREVAPCLDCGGDSQELAHLKSGQHYFLKVKLFDDEILCDFCFADMPSTDPLFWGFPEGFDADENLYTQEFTFNKISDPQSSYEMACSNQGCHNTLRKQQFVLRNAKRWGTILPKKYWPYLES